MKFNSHYVLNHVNIVDLDKGKILADYSLEVKDGTIIRLGYSLPVDPNIGSINLRGCYLLPGLINLHTHLFGDGVPKEAISNKGKSQEKLVKLVKTPVGKAYLRHLAKTNVRNALLSGVTTLRSVGDMRYSDVYVRDLINSGKMEGPRMLVSGYAITCPNGHGDGTISIGCKTHEEYLKVIEENVKNKVDLIKITLTSGVMDALDANHPGDVMMSQEDVNFVVEEAHKRGLEVASHTECQEGIRMCLKAGVDTIEHGSFLDKELIKELKNSKSHIITTISPALPSVMLSQEYSHYSDTQIASCKIVSDGIISCAKELHDNNLLLGLGTDASCPFASQTGMWRELCYYHKYAGASNLEALKAATMNNAKIIHMEDRLGAIKAGKSADMILVNIDPLEDLKTLRSPTMVFHNGKIIINPKPKRNQKLEDMLDELI
ncbi:MAG: amidohydrolase family protein [Bacilli bacterium]